VVEEKLKLAASTAEDCTPYKTKITQLDAKIADLTKQLSTAIAAQKTCEEKLKNTSSIGMSEDCTPYKTKAAELEKKNATLTAQVASLQNQVVQISAEKKAVEEKLKLASTSGEDCTPFKNKVVELEKQLAAAKSDLAKANETIEICNKAKSDLQLQASKSVELESKLNAVNAEKLKLQSDLNAANATISDLEAKLKQASTNNNSTESLQSQINQLKAELAEKNSKISSLSAELNQAKSDLNDWKSKYNECQDALNLLKGDQETLRKQIIRMDEEMGQLGEIIKNKDTEIAKMKSQITTLQSDLKKCNEALNPPSTPSGGN
jgi:chromosome segregation protein